MELTNVGLFAGVLLGKLVSPGDGRSVGCQLGNLVGNRVVGESVISRTEGLYHRKHTHV